MVQQDILTPRELEILRLSVKGMGAKEVGRHLNVSRRTVECHRANIINKTNARNFVHAIWIARKQIEENHG